MVMLLQDVLPYVRAIVAINDAPTDRESSSGRNYTAAIIGLSGRQGQPEALKA